MLSKIILSLLKSTTTRTAGGLNMPLEDPAIGERGVLQGQRQCQWDSLHGSLAISEGFHEDNYRSVSICTYSPQP
jgi:hypothetical protein